MVSHQLPECPVTGQARLDLAALGEFPTSNRTSESLSLQSAGAELGIPAATLAVEATAELPDSERRFIAYSERHADHLDFLLWPEGSACPLFQRSAGDSYPGRLGGEGIGYARNSGLIMVAGSNDATSAAIVGALTFDTRTGESHVVDPRLRAVLREPRAFASVSDFGDRILVAGGENPIHDASLEASVLRGTAELYDPATRSFEIDLLALAVPRARHAALTLDSGEVALFGGRAEDSEASSFVEVLSPSTRVSKLVGNLSVGRRDPQAIQLGDGRILVAGGLDAASRPLGDLEWRDADAGQLRAAEGVSTSLPPRFNRAFIALSGGAALAVGGCEDRRAMVDEDCSIWCARGCPPTPSAATKQRYDAFWLAPDGSVSALDFPFSAARPSLLPGNDGRPYLVTAGVDASGQPQTGGYAVYRFDPWKRVFLISDLDLGSSMSEAARFVATGPDAFAWFGDARAEPALSGVRNGTRSAYANDIALVSQRDADDATRPAHLVPDFLPSDRTVQYDSARAALRFARLKPHAATPCVWISDADYASFAATIDFSSDAAPTLALGAERITDLDTSKRGSCALPAQGSGPGSVHIVRREGHVLLTISGAESRCELGAGRLPLGVCGSALGQVEVTRIVVTRGG